MSKLTVITPPDEPAVSLAVAKDYLRIGHDGEDQLISELLRAAQSRLEQIAGLALVRQTLQITWLQWPSAIAGRGVRLPITPVIGLKSVTLLSDESVETVVTDRFATDCGRLCLKPWSMLPRLDLGDLVKLSFEAGFGSVDDVPDDLQEAVLRLLAASYGARQSGVRSSGLAGGIPVEVQSILDARKTVRL